MNGIYLLLGSNLGDRLEKLRTASKSLEERQIKILNESSVYETEPWGVSDQPWFLNVVLQIETALQESKLLETCLKVEEDMGRSRIEKWGARLIDIDILYYNDIVLDTNSLQLPHPEIANRKFTLLPLCELIPNQPHPISKLSQVEMLTKCKDELDCRQTELHL
ncbi:MAG: 2-amino-4-hydroxy-6-hydroxymethyldihydropteridine diphosphokinase [Cyclobacteriaceae bacterium]